MAKQNGTSRSSQSRPSSQARTGGESGGGSQRRQTTAAAPRGGTGRSRAAGGNRGGGSQQSSQRGQAQRSSQGESSSRRGTLAGARTRVVDTVRENPIPAALIGAGLAWLLVKNRQRLPTPHLPESLSGLADAARESFTGTAQSTRHAVRGGVESAAESVKSGAATVAEYAQSGASKVSQVAKKGFARSRDAVATTWDEHPLTAGLALLAAGVAAGMMLPAPKGGAITRAAKGLTERVASRGEELLDNATKLVSSSARAISREAKRQGLTPNQLSRKVKRVANAAAS